MEETAAVMRDDKRARRSAVADAAQSGAGGYLGDLVAWDFRDDSGFSAPRDRLANTFENHGFQDIVERHLDLKDVLLRARSSGGIVVGRGIIVKTIDRHRKDTPACIGIYKKLSRDGEVGDHWEGGARVRHDQLNDRVVALPLEGQAIADGDCMKVAESIAARANHIIGHVSNIELSVSLCQVGRKLMWAKFRRKKGGAWFVHARHAERFRGLLDEVERYGGFWATVQPIHVDSDGRSMRNVTYAGQGMLESEIQRLRDDLAKVLADGMRDSAIERRIAECDDLLARADLYSELLAGTSTDIAAQAREVREQFERALLGDEPDAFFDDVESVTAEAKPYFAALEELEEAFSDDD